jgi:hypothetical protein
VKFRTHADTWRYHAAVKILFVRNLIVAALSEADRANILEAAGPASRMVPARDAATQRREPRVIVTPHTAGGSIDKQKGY